MAPLRDQTYGELWYEQLPGNSGQGRERDSLLELLPGGVIPKITGLILTPSYRSIVATWDEPAIEGTIFYEVEIANNASFTDSSATVVGGTRFEFMEADQGITYYFRVRGRLGNEFIGAFSDVGNAQASVVVNPDIPLDTITVPTTASTAAQLNLNTTPNAETTIQSITVTTSGLGFPIFITTCWSDPTGATYQTAVRIYRDGIQIYNSGNILVGGSFRVDLTAWSWRDFAAAGVHTYETRVIANGPITGTPAVANRVMTVVELKA